MWSQNLDVVSYFKRNASVCLRNPCINKIWCSILYMALNLFIMVFSQSSTTKWNMTCEIFYLPGHYGLCITMHLKLVIWTPSVLLEHWNHLSRVYSGLDVHKVGLWVQEIKNSPQYWICQLFWHHCSYSYYSVKLRPFSYVLAPQGILPLVPTCNPQHISYSI